MKKVMILMCICLSGLVALSQDYLREGNECFDKGDYECARKRYEAYKVVSGSGGQNVAALIDKCTECLQLLPVADYLYSKEEYAEARLHYEQIRKLNPNDPVAAERLRVIEEIQGLLKDTEMLVYVEGGTFMMGCTSEQSKECWDNEKPVHQVTLTSYYIGKYPVTVAQFQEFVEATNYITEAEKSGGSKVWSGNHWGKKAGVTWRCDVHGKERPYSDYNHPVVHVSWNDAVAFCKWAGGRLPTEAEWEFAARGGNKSRGYKYSGSNNIDDVAWYQNNSDSITHPVGQKLPNELGIYDMSGNSSEWCSDKRSTNYKIGAYSDKPQTNPKGMSKGNTRVLRGGDCRDDAMYGRVSSRGHDEPSSCAYYTGFRLVVPVGK